MRAIKPVTIGEFTIGSGNLPFLIAEVGVNHNGDIEAAKKMVRAAKQAGAHAVKFQSFRADKIADRYLMEKKNVEAITGGSKSAYDMYKALELSENMHTELLKTAADENIMFLSSAFDEDGADFLESLGVDAFKVASSDLTHLPLIEHIARKGKPIIISTGMGTLLEVEQAVETCYRAGNVDIILLHCVSSYPPADQDVNLSAMTTLQERFAHPVGYSDHCEGLIACMAASAMGAAVIEKHFTLDAEWPGPDQQISATRDDFEKLVYMVNQIHILRGDGIKRPSASEYAGIQPSRRSLRILGGIKAGDVITADKIIALKPEIGIKPASISDVLGRRVRADMSNHEPLTWDKIE